MLGDSFYTVMLLWMTQSLTRASAYNALWIGLVVASGYVARLVIGPVAGVFVDRLNKRAVMMATDGVRAALMAILSALFLFHSAHVWELLCFHFILSGVSTLFAPANLSLQRQIVPEDQLIQANSILTTTQKTCEFLGPGICGVLIGTVGMAPALIFDCASFIVSVGSLTLVKHDEERHATKPMSPATIVSEMGDGVRTLVSIPLARRLVPFMLTYNFAAHAFDVLLIIFVSHTLHLNGARGATLFGFFQSAMALGDIVGGILSGFIAKRVRTEHIIIGGMALSSALVFVVGFSRSDPLICVYLFFISMGSMTSIIAFTTVMQVTIPQHQLGRVWSLISASFNGSASMSQILATWMATFVSIGHIYPVVGIVCATVTGFAYANPTIRRYRPNQPIDANQSQSVGT